MRYRFSLAALALAAAVPAIAQPSRDDDLHAFLQERFGAERANHDDTRYSHGWADLNGDGRPEAFVYLMSQEWCGSGGCHLFIYTPEQNSFQQLARISITNPPVQVLNSRTGGWRDISVVVSGGGVRAHHVRLSQRGGTYPGNPTVPPAQALRRPPRGEVMIHVNNRGRKLF